MYVPLTTQAAADEAQLREESRGGTGSNRDDSPTLLLDRLGRESLYVTGAPGSGKSTFCRWLAWLSCEGAVPPSDVEAPEDLREKLPASLDGRLPLVVPLRAFWHRLPQRAVISSAECEVAITAWLHDRKAPGLVGEVVAAHLAQGSALMILDGLDEVPSDRRAALISALADGRQHWTGTGNRLLVTSRPYGLSESEVRRLGLPHAPIQPLVDSLQILLVRRWFRILLDDEGQADATSQEFRRQVHAQPWLAPLMANPLLLTASASSSATAGGCPKTSTSCTTEWWTPCCTAALPTVRGNNSLARGCPWWLTACTRATGWTKRERRRKQR